MQIDQRPTEHDERELMARIADRDVAAFHQLYRHYFPTLQRYLSRLLRGGDDAEELINDVMLVVWQKAATFNGSCKVSTWIFGIAHNKVLKECDARRARQADVSLDEAEPLLPGLACRELRRLEAGDFLDKVLAKLSGEQRRLVELTYFHGLNYGEVAALLGCPDATVKTRIFHMRQKLRRTLEEVSPGGLALAPVSC